MSRSDPELIFVHGLAKKPPPDTLRDLWLWGLDTDNPKPEVFGYDNPGIGVASKAGIQLTYWADIFYTDVESDLKSYYESAENPRQVEGLDRHAPATDDLPPARSVEEQAYVERLLQVLGVRDDDPAAVAAAAAPRGPFENVPLPSFLKKQIVKQFATEAYYFLYGKPFARSDGRSFPMRDALRERLVSQIQAATARSDRVIVVAHSMGTMMAYDCLKNVPECPPIAGLITLGSPLGVDEVQGPLMPEGGADDAFPARLRGPWINVFDRKDPVAALDPKLANDFRRQGQPVIQDIEEANWGDWRHTITHYLAGPKMRGALRGLMGIG